MLTHKGVTKSALDWAEELGINAGTLRSRINKYGWSVEKALGCEEAKGGMSNFLEVKHMNEVFGNNAVGWDWGRLQRQFLLIAEEFRETYDAIQDEDKTEVVDGACDLLVTAYGLLHLAGVDADLAMSRVNESNLSKLCITAEELSASVAHYARLGVMVEGAGELPEAYVRVIEDCEDNTGKPYPKGKFLKSVEWKGPNFEGVVE
jgi:hypothetical protein